MVRQGQFGITVWVTPALSTKRVHHLYPRLVCSAVGCLLEHGSDSGLAGKRHDHREVDDRSGSASRRISVDDLGSVDRAWRIDRLWFCPSWSGTVVVSPCRPLPYALSGGFPLALARASGLHCFPTPAVEVRGRPPRLPCVTQKVFR